MDKKKGVFSMKYVVVSSSEFTYPDRTEYVSSSRIADVFTARGTYATFQVLFTECVSDMLPISIEGLPDGVTSELYTLRSVMVEQNQGITEEQRQPHYPERVAPYRIYDCLRTFDGTLDLTDGRGGIYVALKAEKDSRPGLYDRIVLKAGELCIPVKLEIFSAVLPEETLTMINGFSERAVCRFHHVEYLSEEYLALEKKYLAMLRRLHQNMMYVGGCQVSELGNNEYSFDFTEMIDEIRRYREAGMKYFDITSVGHRKSWSESTIYLNRGFESMSYEGYRYLMQYLPALKKVLEENGWLDSSVMGVADEPNPANATEYRALCGLIHRIVPEIRLCDAMSYGNLHGALDIWIPLNAEYDQHQEALETFREGGSEIWHYVCCGPRGGGYINRFMDYPLLSTRYLHWGNYKYNLTGYLHWAANCYQPGQDPFEQNCPEHHNADAVCFLPAGDTHLIYPGTDGPWMSIRLEAQREGAEDYELLKALAEKDKLEADRICAECFTSFREVSYDVNSVIRAKRELLSALSR